MLFDDLVGSYVELSQTNSRKLNRGSSFNFRIFTKLLSYYLSPMGSEGERLRNIKSPRNVLTYLEEVQNI